MLIETTIELMINMDTKSYNKLFSIDNNEQEPTEKHKRAFAQVSDIRKFEIEMYWKRATYFWTLIAVAFTGYFAILAATNLNHKFLYSLLIASMGLVFTFSWCLVNRGSKYWQENWENHLDLLEDKITGPLYKTVLERPSPSDPIYKLLGHENVLDNWFVGPKKLSVSKINQWVALYVLFVWFCLVVVTTMLNFIVFDAKELKTLLVIAVFGVNLSSIIAMSLMVWQGKTHIGSCNPKARVRKTNISG